MKDWEIGVANVVFFSRLRAGEKFIAVKGSGASDHPRYDGSATVYIKLNDPGRWTKPYAPKSIDPSGTYTAVRLHDGGPAVFRANDRVIPVAW